MTLSMKFVMNIYAFWTEGLQTLNAATEIGYQFLGVLVTENSVKGWILVGTLVGVN